MSSQMTRFLLSTAIAAVIFVLMRMAGAMFWGIDMPWVAIAALMGAICLVFHKRIFFRDNGIRSKRSAFFFVALTYFAPAVVCWSTAVIVLINSTFPALGGVGAQFFVLAGMIGLVQLLIQKELVALREG